MTISNGLTGNKIMNSLCDVQGCSRETYMGWRPLTERLGRQVCKYHWRRHKDELDSFDLYEVFKFRRPEGIRKPMLITSIEKKQICHGQKILKPVKSKGSGCKACGAERETGHTYCQKCARYRQRQLHQRRQKRYRTRLAQVV